MVTAARALLRNMQRSAVKRAGDSEKRIQHDMVKNLRTLGFDVSSFSQARASNQTRGIPDLYATHARFRIVTWIEVKRPGQNPTPVQAAWHVNTRIAGGNVIVVRSLDELLAGLRELGAPI